MTMKSGTQVITFRTSKELKERVEAVAAEQDRSVNNFLTHVVKNYLDTYEQAVRKEN